MSASIFKLPSTTTINEIEAISKSKIHDNVVAEIKTDPKIFKNFTALAYIEYNVRVLAEEHMDKYKKNIISSNVQIKEIAIRFISRSSAYKVIKEITTDPTKLRSDRHVEMLIKTVKDCVESAYVLAIHRKQIRESANIEELLDGQAVMKQQLNTIVQNIRHNQQPQHLNPQCAPLSVSVNESVPLNESTAAVAHIEPSQPPVPSMVSVAPAAVVAPNTDDLFSIVPEEQCRALYSLHPNVEKFAPELIHKLLTLCEIILPLKEIPNEKKIEFYRVLVHFFPDQRENCESILKNILTRLRNSKRTAISSAVGESKGCGVTTTGTKFFYLRPLSKNMFCYSRKECSPGSHLTQTKAIGNVRIPQTVGDFEYLLLIEKNGKYNIRKLLPDGTIMTIC